MIINVEKPGLTVSQIISVAPSKFLACMADTRKLGTGGGNQTLVHKARGKSIQYSTPNAIPHFLLLSHVHHVGFKHSSLMFCSV